MSGWPSLLLPVPIGRAVIYGMTPYEGADGNGGLTFGSARGRGEIPHITSLTQHAGLTQSGGRPPTRPYRDDAHRSVKQHDSSRLRQETTWSTKARQCALSVNIISLVTMDTHL